VAYFASLQIDVGEAKSLYQLLDTDEDGSIAIEEFVLGCMRLKGMAKAVDIAMIMYETKKQALLNKLHVADVKHSLEGITKEVMRNTTAIQKNMCQINENTHQIHQNIKQFHANQHHVLNYQEVNNGHEYGRLESEKQGSLPPCLSSSSMNAAISSIFHQDMNEIWKV